MKKRSIGKQLLFMGSILTVAIACQPKASNAKSSPCEDQNPTQQYDEDTDDGACGDGDTSTSCDESSVLPVHKVEPATDVADIKDVDVDAVKLSETVLETSAVKEEQPSSEVVILEAVSPVEITPEHQEVLPASSEN